MIVRVPATSANLGPGFDALAVALSLHLELGVVDRDLPSEASGVAAPIVAADPNHPAIVAYRSVGGTNTLWVRSPIPMGRGLGFSGAARVAGLVYAHAERAGVMRIDELDAATTSGTILAEATALEGHADNVAASLFGGVVAVASGTAIRVPLALDPAVVVWVPSETTSTAEARSKLPSTVSREDAVFNIGQSSLLVAALAAGDEQALRVATQDRLHEDLRFQRAPQSRAARDAALAAGAWSAWLSGSGPTVAAFCAPEAAPSVASALGEVSGGSVKTLHIDDDGATIMLSPRVS